jgi:Peptidase family S41
MARKTDRISTAQRGMDYAACYAAAVGKPLVAARGAPKVRARGGLAAQVLRGPFLAPGSLTRAERLRTVDAFLRVLEGAYTHLPGKRARYAFDPVQRLRILRGQAPSMTDEAFHIELADILTRLRDAHTRYVGPSSLEDVVAVLPFYVEMIGSTDAARYVVTQVTDQRLARSFRAGVVVDYWNGVPIDLAVQRWSEHEIGGRPDSQRANAVLSLTMRSLQYGAPPDEHWVIVGYRQVDARGEPTGALQEVRAPWRIVIPKKAAARAAKAQRKASSLALRLSVNPAAAAVRRAKMLMFAPASLATGAKRLPRNSIESHLPETLRSSVMPTPQGPIAVLRLWAFDTEPTRYLQELMRLLPLLPQDGLIIDVRGNPGGYIEAAEGSLQFFTPKAIAPTRFSVLATPFTRALAVTPGAAQDLAPWRQSLDDAVRNGELYSRALPISDAAACNAIGQIYGGPVVLVADATTYSSGDLFSAGFVDNGIGRFVCVGEATGAGGANVWDYKDLRAALKGTADALPKLPDGIGLTLSFRRATRIGPSEGLAIEDVGVAGPSYAMTRADLLDSNRDLMAHCVSLLRQMPLSHLAFEVHAAQNTLRVTTRGIERLDVRFDEVPAPSVKPKDDQPVELRWPAGARRAELVGVSRRAVVQRRLIDLRR